MEVDYGEIRHRHTHIHSVPEPHIKTVNNALKDWCISVYKEEQICNSLNESHFEELLTTSNNFGQEPSPSESGELSNIYVKLLEKQGTRIEKKSGESGILDGTKILTPDESPELKIDNIDLNLNLDKNQIFNLLKENDILMENINKIDKNIDNKKLTIPDNLTPKRKIELLENMDYKIYRELILLIIYLIIGILFGIYCIYFFFIVELK
tara:strand:- start:1509 stop:2135 length:627 start_codon:yes stop_codon:yes gene_type:complete